METDTQGVPTWAALGRTPTTTDFDRIDSGDPATVFMNDTFRATHLWAASEYYDMIRVLALLLNGVEIDTASGARNYMAKRRWTSEAQRGDGLSAAFTVGHRFAAVMDTGEHAGTVVVGALVQAAKECRSPYNRSALVQRLDDDDTLWEQLNHELIAVTMPNEPPTIEQLAQVVAYGVKLLGGQLPYVWEIRHSVNGDGGEPASKAPENFSHEVVTVTPELAKEWLGLNEVNRKTRDEKDRQYSEDMREHRWVFNGDPIRFDNRGKVIDGQHRLRAVVLSGVAIQFLVVRALVPEAQATMDIGMARTTADVLGFAGFPNPTMCGSIVRWFLIRESGGLRQSTTVSPSKPQITEWAEAHRDEVIRAGEVSVLLSQRTTLPVSPSAIGLGYLLCARKDREAADTFFVHNLIGGYELHERHPAAQFSRRLQTLKRTTGMTMQSDDALAYLIQAWNLWRQGREVDKVQAPKGGWNAGNVPEPL